MTKTQVYSCTLHRDTDTVCTRSFPPYLAFHLYEVALSVQLIVTYAQCFFSIVVNNTTPKFTWDSTISVAIPGLAVAFKQKKTPLSQP